MRLENIFFLWGLLLIPLLIALTFFAFRKRKKMIDKFSKSPLFNININKISIIKNYRIISAVLIISSIATLIFALAQPKWGILESSIFVDSYDVVFVLDLSASMNAKDISPSRLDRARYEIIEFIKKTNNIRVGLVVFAGSNFIASPLTHDSETFIAILNSLSTSSMSVGGSRIVDALDTAKNIFIENTDSTKSLILITDGEDNTSDNSNTQKIIDTIRDDNIRIYSVSIGTAEGEYIPDFDSSGRAMGYKKDSSGSLITSKREDSLLELIAKDTNGEFYISENGNINFTSIFENIKTHSQSNQSESVGRQYKERYQIFVFIAIVLIIAEIVLSIFVSYKTNVVDKNENKV